MAALYNSGGRVSAQGITRFYSGTQTILTGLSGAIATITPPSDQRARLIGLSSVATIQKIDISVGGSLVVDGLDLDWENQNATGGIPDFAIANPDTGISSLSLKYEIVGDIGEEIIILSDLATTQLIRYAFVFEE